MKHVNAIRKTIRRLVKKQGRLHRVITSFWPITAKPIQIRMGKGKGAVSYWAGRVSSGTVVSSFKKITLKLAQKSLRAGSTKVPGRTKVLINNLLRWGRNNEL
jgi:large subunit ribosomal protein L16